MWVHWKPYILQSPATVARQLWDLLGTSYFWQACWATAQQAVIGYALVIVIGGIVGTAVARLRGAAGRHRLADHRHADHAVGALVPARLSWSSESTWKAIILMMVLGAAPAVANGFISGIDQVPPGLLRVGRILGAHGLALERHVVLPAAFPSVLGGLKQGWAFAWHALMAGEFLVLVNAAEPRRPHGQRTTQGDYGVVVATDDRHRVHRDHGRHRLHPGRPLRPPALRPVRDRPD